jgi:ubiquinone/menaquinone biosynthesis C-methylase UbiE
MLAITNMEISFMLNKFFQNCRKPEGLGGRILLASMNLGHRSVSEWGLKHLRIRPGDLILDIGCGGGRNIARMLKRAPEGRVCGLDYSEVSVEKSITVNRWAVLENRVEVRQGSVSQNPWPDNFFDIVTAFETVYFWPDFINDIREVRRVLKPGGVFFICNEMNIPDNGKVPYQYWIKMLALKVYSAADFRNLLDQAGFTDIKAESRGNTRLCVSAKAKKAGEEK